MRIDIRNQLFHTPMRFVQGTPLRNGFFGRQYPRFVIKHPGIYDGSYGVIHDAKRLESPEIFPRVCIRGIFEKEVFSRSRVK